MPRVSRVCCALMFGGLLALATCVKTSTTPPSEGGTSSDPTVPGGAVDPGQSGGEGGDPSHAGPPTSQGCLSDADCHDGGGICEGMGCGPDQPGTCVPSDRMCTRDSVVYCGCDGKTFRASGSCPGQRYANKGECSTAAPAPGSAATGSPCLKASECSSGICEGQGCGPDQPGTCAAADRMCTRDYRAYCGCDGKTFHGSGSCPGQRYAAKGECGTAPSPGGA